MKSTHMEEHYAKQSYDRAWAEIRCVSMVREIACSSVKLTSLPIPMEEIVVFKRLVLSVCIYIDVNK